MKQQQILIQRILIALRKVVKTAHGRIVLAGLIVVLSYISVRIAGILIHSLSGSVGILMLVAVGLGLWQLWQQQHRLKQIKVTEEDRLIGHILILSGIGVYPFVFTDLWSQAFVCLLILVGISCSCWGVSFFRHYPLPTFLIVMGFFPQPTIASKTLWEALTPPLMLERFMAWAGGIGLQWMGYSVHTTDRFIITSVGAVEVAWGCNGFYMATTMMVASLLLGLFLKQTWQKILLMMGIGALLALVLNIPRVMLMTIAAIYWGKSWFAFWHGGWGGQFFVTVLFTLYYYIAMALFKNKAVNSTQ